jgi:hypothetical protein
MQYCILLFKIHFFLPLNLWQHLWTNLRFDQYTASIRTYRSIKKQVCMLYSSSHLCQLIIHTFIAILYSPTYFRSPRSIAPSPCFYPWHKITNYSRASWWSGITLCLYPGGSRLESLPWNRDSSWLRLSRFYFRPSREMSGSGHDR